jgi:hypothetical protein
LPKLRFVPTQRQGLAHTLGGVIHLLQNLLAVALERRTKLPVHVVIEETVSSVELQQQHTRFGTMEEHKFL